jgi:broad specificity phosphatase PhoE
MTRRIVLVRHPPVAAEFDGVCYGRSDVPLGVDGVRLAARLADSLAAEPTTHLYHSDLSRCAEVACRIGTLTGVTPQADPRLRERCFGEWEGRRWDDIHAETGDDMMGMVTAPHSWHPPGGETTFSLRDRVLSWFSELPPVGSVVAITHGGPIAALRGSLAGLPVAGWAELIPACGEVVVLTAK